MKWEASTFRYGKSTSIHATAQDERDTIATMAVFTALGDGDGHTWPTSSKPPHHWNRSWTQEPIAFRGLKYRHHCRYSGEFFDERDATTINGVTVSNDIAEKFKQLPIFDDGLQILDINDIMFDNVKEPQEIADRLENVLKVDINCDSPAAKALVRKYVNSGLDDQDLNDQLRSVPFYHIYKEFRLGRADIANVFDKIKEHMVSLKDKTYLVRIADLGIVPDLSAINLLSTNAKTTEILKNNSFTNRLNSLAFAGALTGIKQGYIFFDFTEPANPAMDDTSSSAQTKNILYGISRRGDMNWKTVNLQNVQQSPKVMKFLQQFTSAEDSSLAQQLIAPSTASTPSSFLQIGVLLGIFLFVVVMCFVATVVPGISTTHRVV